MPPSDEANHERRQQGRNLAMDTILQDALKTAATADQPHSAPASRPTRALTLAIGAAASAAAIWGLLWGSGMLEGDPRPTPQENQLAGKNPDPLRGQGPGAQQPTGSGPKGAGAPEGQAGAPGTRQQPGIAARPAGKGLAGSPMPAAGTELKRQEIPAPNASGQISIPASADPADIKLLRSAEAMLAAEAELERRIRAGGLPGIDQLLKFDEISNWPYTKGIKGMPEAVAKLADKEVVMTGFMLPIDEVENIKEFLLVKSLWSCCYGQPPDVHGTVRVVMQNKKVDYAFDPIQVRGTFRISETIEDGFCLDIYQLEADSVKVIE